MNEHVDPSSTTTPPRERSVSSTWLLISLGAPSLIFFFVALALVSEPHIPNLMPVSTFESLVILCIFVGSFPAVLAPIFGSYHLERRLHPNKRFNMFFGFLLWMGVMIVNGFVMLALCFGTLGLIN
jgi:hypothetical protein